jgi:hypothetical protein
MSPVNTMPHTNGHVNGHVNGSSTTGSRTMKPRKNIALVTTPDHQIYMKEIPFPIAASDEAIVHVKATG